MIASINREFAARRSAIKNSEFILEAVLGVEEVLPGSDAEMEDVIDVDSVPEDAYNKIDKILDQIVESEDYDDTEADEMLDDEFDESEVPDDEIDTIMEAAISGNWDPFLEKNYPSVLNEEDDDDDD